MKSKALVEPVQLEGVQAPYSTVEPSRRWIA